MPASADRRVLRRSVAREGGCGYAFCVTTATSSARPPAALAEPMAGEPITTVAASSATAPPSKLEKAEIARLLTGLPNAVAEQIFKVVEGQVNAETARQQRIDAKATSLLTAVGLSLTVAFSFGAVLLKDGRTYWHDTGVHTWVVVVFGAALLTGVVAAFCALLAVMVRTYDGMNERAVFSEQVLDRVREVASETQDLPGDQSAKRAAAQEAALAQYQMSMIMQMWQIVQGIRQNHARKTPLVKGGQVALVLFLGCIAILFALLGWAAYH